MSFTAYTVETAKQAVKPMLEGIQKLYGFLPNVFTTMAESPIAVKSYLDVNTNLTSSQFSETEQQIAMLVVSVKNGCKFCSAAHRAMAIGAGVDRNLVEQIKAGDFSAKHDFTGLVNLISSLMDGKGGLTPVQVADFNQLGFSNEKIIEAIVIISLKTLSNYSNRLTGVEPNAQLLG